MHKSIELIGEEAGQNMAAFVGNPHDQGWYFPVGDPEFWKFSERMLIKGGRALDLGMGDGRTSWFFAMQGMEVTAFENSPPAIDYSTEMIKSTGLPITIEIADIIEADLGKNRYDTVIAGQTFVHFPSKAAALEVAERAIEAIKPGGHLWIRAGGKYHSDYEELAAYAQYYPEVTRLDEDTFTAPCSCSGEYKIEPQLFLDPVELLGFVARRGLKIVHTQIMPEQWRNNIMFGEDFNRSRPKPPLTGGLITILAQK